MTTIQIIVDPELLYQRQVLNLTVEGQTKRVVLEIRYLYATEKWYVSMFDAQTGDPYCTYVPIIASNTLLNNLFEPYQHKRIGWLACFRLNDDTKTDNPSRYNWDEFGLIWGDSFD